MGERGEETEWGEESQEGRVTQIMINDAVHVVDSAQDTLARVAHSSTSTLQAKSSD